MHKHVNARPEHCIAEPVGARPEVPGASQLGTHIAPHQYTAAVAVVAASAAVNAAAASIGALAAACAYNAALADGVNFRSAAVATTPPRSRRKPATAASAHTQRCTQLCTRERVREHGHA